PRLDDSKSSAHTTELPRQGAIDRSRTDDLRICGPALDRRAAIAAFVQRNTGRAEHTAPAGTASPDPWAERSFERCGGKAAHRHSVWHGGGPFAIRSAKTFAFGRDGGAPESRGVLRRPAGDPGRRRCLPTVAFRRRKSVHLSKSRRHFRKATSGCGSGN